MNTQSTNQDSDFSSIDDIKGWPIFMITLLRLGRALLKDENSVREVMDTKVCKLMAKHRNELPNVYRIWELRELLENYCPDVRGGGIKVEWTEITGEGLRARRKYYLNFERIYKPQQNDVSPGPAPSPDQLLPDIANHQ